MGHMCTLPKSATIARGVGDDTDPLDTSANPSKQPACRALEAKKGFRSLLARDLVANVVEYQHTGSLCVCAADAMTLHVLFDGVASGEGVLNPWAAQASHLGRCTPSGCVPTTAAGSSRAIGSPSRHLEPHLD